MLQVSLEQPWGHKLEFCWEYLSWRTPIINGIYSPVVVDIQLTEMVKNKPLSHLVFTDNQVFLSADLLLLHHNAHTDGPEPQHTLSERLSFSSVAEHHFWIYQLLSEFAGLCILILMTDFTLGFSNASGFIRSNSGSRAAWKYTFLRNKLTSTLKKIKPHYFMPVKDQNQNFTTFTTTWIRF